MSNRDLSLVDWFRPEEKRRVAITIPNMHAFNLSASLIEMLPSQRIEIGVLGADTIFLHADESGYRIPKSGSINALKPIAALVGAGLSLPARFAVEPEGEYWVASLERTSVEISTQPSKVSKKPRKRGLGNLLDGGDGQ